MALWLFFFFFLALSMDPDHSDGRRSHRPAVKHLFTMGHHCGLGFPPFPGPGY